VFLLDRELFGDLGTDPRFVVAFTEALGTLREHGVATTLQTLGP
jgi:hypothetical protein